MYDKFYIYIIYIIHIAYIHAVLNKSIFIRHFSLFYLFLHLYRNIKINRCTHTHAHYTLMGWKTSQKPTHFSHFAHEGTGPPKKRELIHSGVTQLGVDVAECTWSS